MQKTLIDRELLARIADAVPAMVALYNIYTGQYLYVNRAVEKLLGYTPDEVMTGGYAFLAGLVHPDDLPQVVADNQRALDAANAGTGDGQEPIASFEYRMRHHNGDWRWLHTDGTVFERRDGQVEQILNISLDITERKAAEQRLERSLQMLEKTLHSN